MKYLYLKPAAEELQELPAAIFLQTSGEGDLEGYTEGEEFVWK